MNKFEKPIYVTKPYLPPFKEFCEELEEIWENQWITNNGPILKRFQRELENYCTTDNVCLFNNGTLALQIALQGMKISGEVITTPFTFVATTHALYWNKIRPVFCDIEPNFFTLDPKKVEELITPWTTAILAVHVFGHPCQLEALSDIAKRHNLKLIYDAAHAFGVKVNGLPIGKYGDLSMFSFHATKLYHSIEGGMLTFNDASLKQTFDYLKNFGFKNETEVVMPGTNAKMNEFQALMGSMVLKKMNQLVSIRKRLYDTYKKGLIEIPGISCRPDPAQEVEYNYAYMPILINEKEYGMSRDNLYYELKKYNIFTRRYFYPLLNEFACYQSIPITKPLNTAESISNSIITLPLYSDLMEDDVHMILEILHKIHTKAN